MEDIKYTVQAVIFNDKGEVLAVSRKTDHNDFGLAGGKVDEEDYQHGLYEPFQAALKREVKEETGLDISVNNIELVLAMHKNGYMGYTYLIKDWSGSIEYDEPHVVKWVPFETIIAGSFGKYNQLVAESLDDMGVKYKMFAS